MSYTNGIGDLKQALSSIAPATAAETQQVNAAKPKDITEAALAQPREDETRLSSTSGLLTQALEGSDVRTAKVEAIKQAIASGSYNVSSSDVADKMIQSLLD